MMAAAINFTVSVSLLALLTFGAGIVPNGTPQMALHASGNLGIGTISPTHKLTVSGGDSWILPTTPGANSALYLSNFNNVASQPAYAIRGGDIGQGVFGIHSYRWAGTYDFTSEGPVGSQIPFRFYTNTLARLSNFALYKPKANTNDPDDPRVFLSEAGSYFVGGNVGIGTTNPGYRLSVATPGSGSSQVHINSSNPSDDSGMYLMSASASNGFMSGGSAYNGANWVAKSTAAWELGGGPTGISAYYDTSLTPGNSFAPTVRFKIDPSGNVGIGTAAPQFKLAVNGTIGTKEVVVTNTGWADYVFNPGFRLQPLKEIDAYIKRHRRLPEIPSEAEVKANGIGLGEMQVKLLAKIEELTLHMIQANNDNLELRDRIAQLLERIAQLLERIARLEEHTR